MKSSINYWNTISVGNRFVALLSSRLILLSVLFIAAFAIRLVHIDEPPLNFHATRQYRSFIIARGFYFDGVASIPEWENQVAQVSLERQGVLEPPIMELIVSVGYRILGGENFWLAHVLSSIFWLIGGVLLYLIGKKIADDDVALLCMAFYLFLPFAVVASRSFQPDPLMVVLIVASIWAILRYHDAPSNLGLLIAAALSACAFLVKPGSVFAIAAVFIATRIYAHGIRRAMLSRALIIFFMVTLAPTLLVYAYGTIAGTFLVRDAYKTLLPQLWLSEFFWSGWLTNISLSVGIIPLMGGLLGIITFKSGLPRVMMLAWWIGYVLFCLAFDYNIAAPTHDYYHLQLVPIVGLSFASFAVFIFKRIGSFYPHRYLRTVAVGILSIAILFALFNVRARLTNPNWEHKVAIEQEIGELVQHSTRTVYLSSDYGVPLEYHGLLSGAAWPLSSDLEWEQLASVQSLAPKERLAAWFNFSPEYFIVEDLDQLMQQQELQQFLSQNSTVVAQTQEYVIFDLRRE